MIRLADRDDAAAMTAIYAPVVAATAISFEIDPPSVEEMGERIAATLRLAPWLAYARCGNVLGYAYARRHRDRAAYQWSVDVSVYVDEGHRREGIGRALYRSLLAALHLQGFYAAHAGITLPNPASVALHESFGFRSVGVYPNVGFKQGAWRDVGWWQLGLRRPEGAPVPPRSLAEALGDPAWASALSGGYCGR